MKKLYFSIFYFVSCSLFLTAQVEQKKEASQDIINFNNRVGNKNIINEIDILLDENYPQYNISDILKTGLNGIAIELNKKYEIKICEDKKTLEQVNNKLRNDTMECSRVRYGKKFIFKESDCSAKKEKK